MRQPLSARRFAAGLLLLLLAAGALRLAVLEAVFPPRLLGDEPYYASVALELARDGTHASSTGLRASWPPGHPFALSLVARGDPGTAAGAPARPGDHRALISDRDLRAMLRLQVAIGTVLVGLCAWLGAQLFDRRIGLLAGALAALDPTLVAFSHTLWSDALFTALFVGALLAAIAGRRRESAGLALVAGALFGAAALTREVGLLLAGSVAAWWALSGGPLSGRPLSARPLSARRVAHAALLVVVALALIAPWTARNARVLGRPVLVSTSGWLALRDGNALAPDAWGRPDLEARAAFRERYWRVRGELERMQLARREALALIRDAQPSWLLQKLTLSIPALFGPDSYLFYKLRNRAYGDLSRSTQRALLVLVVLFQVAVTSAAILGVAAARGRRALVWVTLLPLVAIHVVSIAASRYRLPWLPLLYAYASFAVLARAELWRMPRRAALVAAAALLLFLGWCVPHFAPRAAEIWRGAGSTAAAALTPGGAAPSP